jgi:hypothetical protein
VERKFSLDAWLHHQSKVFGLAQEVRFVLSQSFVGFSVEGGFTFSGFTDAL